MAAIDFLSRTHCHLGEGPFFCDRRDTLFWFDIVEKKRYAHDFATGTETVLDLPEMASAMGVAADGRDVIAGHPTDSGEPVAAVLTHRRDVLVRCE